MGIGTTRSFADIDEGTQIEVLVADATYDAEGRFGPAVELELEVAKPVAHAGSTILSTFGLSQPRLSKVRDLRADGFDDEAIAAALKNKKFEFEGIDDPETPKLGGALLRIVKACYGGDARAVKKLRAECDTFDDLAAALVGRRFVATTRKDKNDYTRIDGKGEFYRVMPDSSAAENGDKPAPAPKEDWDDLPF